MAERASKVVSWWIVEWTKDTQSASSRSQWLLGLLAMYLSAVLPLLDRIHAICEEENQSKDIISMGSDGRQQQWYISGKTPPKKYFRVGNEKKMFTLAIATVWEGGYGVYIEMIRF